MSSQSTGVTLNRQWELLKMLPTHRTGISAREVTERLNGLGYTVSKRQVERDLKDLSMHFPLLCNDKSKPYGWYWQPSGAAEIPSVSLAESLSLTMIENVIRPLMPSSVIRAIEPRFNQAKEKLKQIEGSALGSWTQKVAHVPPHMPQVPPEIDEQVLETVQHGLLHDKQVTVTYQGANSQQAKTYNLHPLGLVQRGVSTYLVGRVEPHPDVRLFALHRMQSAQASTLTAQAPKNFTLKRYVNEGGMQFTSGERLSLELSVHPDIASLLIEAPLDKSQTITADGDRFVLKAEVFESWQLEWWLLSLAELVEIKSPQSLRDRVASRVEKAAALYAKK